MQSEQTAMALSENTSDAPAAVIEEPKAKGKKGSATAKPGSASKAKSPKGPKPGVPPVAIKQEDITIDEEKEKMSVKDKIKKEYMTALKKEG
jgi:hypothetical protein